MAAPIFALVAALAAGPIELPVEAPLPAGCVSAGERGRYRSPRTYEQTLDFYRRSFAPMGGVRWRNIVSMPGIKARHVASLRKKTRWEGINVYEKQGEVRIYVIPREMVDPSKKP